MILYVDHCPRCPCPIIERDGRRFNGPPDSNKCRHCTADGLRDMLSAYIEAECRIGKLKEDRDRATKGIGYFTSKQITFSKRIEELCRQGQMRIVKIGNQAVVLDWRYSELVISFRELEKP